MRISLTSSIPSVNTSSLMCTLTTSAMIRFTVPIGGSPGSRLVEWYRQSKWTGLSFTRGQLGHLRVLLCDARDVKLINVWLKIHGALIESISQVPCCQIPHEEAGLLCICSAVLDPALVSLVRTEHDVLRVESQVVEL
jgi:hypothetical protein